jgi:hypothetical protein
MTQWHVNSPATRPTQPKLAQVARVPIAGHAQMSRGRSVLVVAVRPCDYMGKAQLASIQECVQHDGACNLLNRRKFHRTLAIQVSGKTPIESCPAHPLPSHAGTQPSGGARPSSQLKHAKTSSSFAEGAPHIIMVLRHLLSFESSAGFSRMMIYPLLTPIL